MPAHPTAAMASRSHPTLGAEQALSLVTDKWFILVVHTLMGGSRRYAELQRAMPGVTKKMLTQTLRRMERDGMVRRTVFPVVPPRTEYCLTEIGESLVPILQSLCRWGQAHYPLIERERARYDEGQAKDEGEDLSRIPATVPGEEESESGRATLSG